MAVSTYQELKTHIGHDINCVAYGKNQENIAIECETCHTILLEFDK